MHCSTNYAGTFITFFNIIYFFQVNDFFFIKARTINDLHYSWFVKILSNCTYKKASEFWENLRYRLKYNFLSTHAFICLPNLLIYLASYIRSEQERERKIIMSFAPSNNAITLLNQRFCILLLSIIIETPFGALQGKSSLIFNGFKFTLVVVIIIGGRQDKILNLSWSDFLFILGTVTWNQIQ